MIVFQAIEGGESKVAESSEDAKEVVDKLMSKENSKDVVAAACREVGSIKTDEFEMRFNPDVLQPLVKHANADVSEKVTDPLRKSKLTTVVVAERRFHDASEPGERSGRVSCGHSNPIVCE